MDLKQRLADTLTDEELDELVTSFDVVGDIAIVKVPDSLAHRKAVIADAVTEQQGNVETVLRKTGERTGDARVADYELLRGDDTETVHREHGCRFALDPTQVYFSERLGTERQRVVAQAAEGETVVDMFAGVGPFTVELARNGAVGHVHACEQHPPAAAYLRENIAMNDVEDRVTVHEGDVRQVLPGDIQADRVVMNLPGQADQFVATALGAVKAGGTIHFYRFAAKDDLWDAAVDTVADTFAVHGAAITVTDTTVCGHYNPAVERVCLDIQVDAVDSE